MQDPVATTAVARDNLARGEKHFLAIEDGVRESTQSWREVLLGMKQRGFTRPAKLAVGDGALGFWAALSEVFPSTRTQRCWMHKTGNVLNYLPKSGQAKAKQGLHEIWMAETRAKAEPPSPAPTATGWSDSCRAGFAPAEGRRLRTAHGKVGLIPRGAGVSVILAERDL